MSWKKYKGPYISYQHFIKPECLSREKAFSIGLWYGSVVKHLPGMCETLSSVPSTGKKGKKRRRKRERKDLRVSLIMAQSVSCSPLNHENLKLDSSHLVNASQAVWAVHTWGHWSSPEVVKRNPRSKPPQWHTHSCHVVWVTKTNYSPVKKSQGCEYKE